MHEVEHDESGFCYRYRHGDNHIQLSGKILQTRPNGQRRPHYQDEEDRYVNPD